MADVEERIRAFLAVEPSDAVRQAIGRLLHRLKDLPGRVSWVRPENVHLTLRFLGDVDRLFVHTYIERIAPDIAEFIPFTARIRGLGAFPNPRRPSVIWVGLETDGDALHRLQQVAENAARSLGLEPEMRRFVPHLTLGRIRRAVPGLDLRDVVLKEQGFDGGAFEIGSVALFSSELSPQGARHTRLCELTFNGIPDSSRS